MEQTEYRDKLKSLQFEDRQTAFEKAVSDLLDMGFSWEWIYTAVEPKVVGLMRYGFGLLFKEDYQNEVSCKIDYRNKESKLWQEKRDDAVEAYGSLEIVRDNDYFLYYEILTPEEQKVENRRWCLENKKLFTLLEQQGIAIASEEEYERVKWW